MEQEYLRKGGESEESEGKSEKLVGADRGRKERRGVGTYKRPTRLISLSPVRIRGRKE